LKVGEMRDGAPVELPVVIVRGRHDGPVLWLHGCVHGDEFCGALIIHEFLRGIDPAQVHGAVVALPVLNLTASRSNQRMSPYEGFNNGDMNRCFPGKANGGFTEQAAYAVYQPLRQYANYLVDFHTAFTPTTRWALYADTGGAVSEGGRRMAEAFGYAHTLPTPTGTLQGSSMMCAGADGIPAFIIEAGGVGTAYDLGTVIDGAERLRNVARAIGLMQGEVTDYGPLTLFSNFHWATAPHGGVYRPAVECGQDIEAGATVGTYYDLHGDVRTTVKAPASGIVLAYHPGPIIPEGDVLIHIGLDPQPALGDRHA
jgi:predicted deacylase